MFEQFVEDDAEPGGLLAGRFELPALLVVEVHAERLQPQDQRHQRIAQLVRRVGDERLLPLHGQLDRLGHAVERGGEPAQLDLLPFVSIVLAALHPSGAQISGLSLPATWSWGNFAAAWNEAGSSGPA
jgi:hypothetical protein